jgi:hypothetical protein
MSSVLENIVLPAWQMVLRFGSVKKLNFFPSLVSTLWLFCIIAYQVTYTYVEVFHKSDELYGMIGSFVKTSYFTETLIIL